MKIEAIMAPITRAIAMIKNGTAGKEKSSRDVNIGINTLIKKIL